MQIRAQARLQALFLASSAIATPLPEVPERFPHAILARAPVPPQEDPFYARPSDDQFARRPAGAIIRQRSATPGQFTILPQNLASAEQVIYKTIDLQGNPEVNALTVFMPKKTDLNADGLPKTLVYQVAEDSCVSGGPCSHSILPGSSSAFSQTKLQLRSEHSAAEGRQRQPGHSARVDLHQCCFGEE